MTLTVVILTLNEAQHIARAVRSIYSVADRVVVVDSGSTDETVSIARSLGAEVLSHPFVTQAKQFNWALTQLPSDTDWVFRLDADEVVSPDLAKSLASLLPQLDPQVAGALVARRMTFLGQPIRFGGLFPVHVLRVFRFGRGHSEDRWMDEHIFVEGEVVKLHGEVTDDNLNTLTWWTDKHNKYASREAVEILNKEFRFIQRKSNVVMNSGVQSSLKRWIKEQIYGRLPGGFRAFIYFIYRFIIRLGFLDGRLGSAFHFLQGFWYRYLVDAKVVEVHKYMRDHDVSVTVAIERVLGIKV